MKALPLWISVPITVAVSLPFGLWLKEWSLPLWAAFIVWAEYFQLGGKPSAIKIMAPAFISGVIGAAFTCVVALLVGKALNNPQLVTAGDLAWFIGLFLGFIPVIYAMKFLAFTSGPGGLCFFNGISMGLATFFVGIYATYGGLSIGADYLSPIVTAIPAILAGLLGCFLGWFNVVIMTPFAKENRVAQAAAA